MRAHALDHGRCSGTHDRSWWRGGRGVARTFLAMLPAVLGGCLGLPTEPSTPSGVSLSSDSVTFFAVGETAQLVATVLDQYGEVMSDAPIAWESSLPLVVDVSQAGLVTARRGGRATITARLGHLRANAAVAVHTPLAVTTASLPAAAPGAGYATSLAAEGGDGSYSWAVTEGSLPGGLRLQAPAGVISGTPTGSTSSFTVEVTSGSGERASRELTLEVNFTVNTTDDVDDGACQVAHCSLREALIGANGHAGPDEIRFEIPGEGVRTIRPRSPLPAITGPVLIDGYTQPGSRPNTRDFPAGSDAVLRIELDGTNAGSTAHGLTVTAGSSVIRGLVINRFGGFGISVQGGAWNAVEGSFVGTDVSGTVARGNGQVGVGTAASNTTIGGALPESRNVISGNGLAGIQVAGVGTGAHGSVVRGNLIGTDVSGTHALGNGSFGVSVFGNSDVEIGGRHRGEGNIVSANALDGVLLAGTSSALVLANLIGTGSGGIESLGNGGHGVAVTGHVASIGARHAADNEIGGTDVGAGNVIRGNRRAGVFITLAESQRNRVLGNAIFENGGLGIDLGSTGVDTNDSDDTDAGSNGLQNYPVLSSLSSGAEGIVVTGSLASAPRTAYHVEVFANDACDASGHGEAQSLLGSSTITTDDRGDAAFTITVPGTLAGERWVTATATDPSGNTSELSRCVSPSAGS